MTDIALLAGAGQQPCPSCGDRRLQRVRNGGAGNLLCPTCGTCWRRRERRIDRVDPLTCPGCQFRRVCLAARAERSP